MKTKKFDKGLFFLILIITIILLTALFLYLQLKTDTIEKKLREEQHIRFAVIIHDGDVPLFSQVLFYYPKTQKGAMFDIPGNTGLLMSDQDKIAGLNTAYNPNNIEEYLGLISYILDIPIDFAIQIDVNDFGKLVDLLGGITMFIADPVEEMDMDPPVLLPSGSLLLDGYKSTQYLTYENKNDSEAEVINRHQNIIQSLLQGIGAASYLTTDHTSLNIYKEILDTNISKSAEESALQIFQDLQYDRMVYLRVRGATRMVGTENLLFPHSEGLLLHETVRQAIESLENDEIISDEELNVTIEILNGTNKTGMASRTANLFQSFGYEIISIRNAENDQYEHTIIYNNSNRLSQTQRVASIIKCSRVETRLEVTEENSSDVTIILGKDFDGRYCKE